MTILKRQTLGDGCLADARLADQHRVVLGAPRKHLHGAADFLVAADDRIELARAGDLGEVAGVFPERVIALFGRSGVGRATFAQGFYGGVDALGRDASLFQDSRGLALLDGKRLQQTLSRDETVAGLGGQFRGRLENARCFRRQIELSRARAFDLRYLSQLRLGTLACRPGVTPGSADEARGKALLVIQQNLQDVLGRKPLVAFAQRQRLRRLDEAACPFGVFLEIHARHPYPAGHAQPLPLPGPWGADIVRIRTSASVASPCPCTGSCSVRAVWR